MPHMDIWSVGDLNRYVRQALEADFRLQSVRVSGEISGFKAYPSGHWYFTLKDANAQLSCAMWKQRNKEQAARFMPREGDAVVVVGNVTLYEVRGQYQLDVLALEPVGEGELYRQFARLKAQLEAEGLFDPRRKRPLPRAPRVIGLVTSPRAAALRDMLNILRRRWPLAEVLLSPTAVQGAEAPPQIVEALRALIEFQPEVIIVGRGGGSLEDLWAFNDERVARAIAASPIPVVSGVGHETDFTLADFAADVRAPTPSAAAELATPTPIADVRVETDTLSERLSAALSGRVQFRQMQLAELTAHLRGLSPQARLASTRQAVTNLQGRLQLSVTHRLELERARLAGLTQGLTTVSPLAVLNRGYALVTRADGTVVRQAQTVTSGEALQVRVSDGAFEVQVVDNSQ